LPSRGGLGESLGCPEVACNAWWPLQGSIRAVWHPRLTSRCGMRACGASRAINSPSCATKSFVPASDDSLRPTPCTELGLVASSCREAASSTSHLSALSSHAAVTETGTWHGWRVSDVVVAGTGARPARLHGIKRDHLQSPRAVVAAFVALFHCARARVAGLSARKVPVMNAGKSAGKHDSGCSSRTSQHTNRCVASQARHFHAHARHGHVYPPPRPERSPHGLAKLGANCRRVHLLGC